MLSFVPGDVPRNPLPAETAGDDVLVALAQLIRALHEASAGWAPPDAVWGRTPANVGRITERTELRALLNGPAYANWPNIQHGTGRHARSASSEGH
jgi:hypothetical protein